MRQLLTLYAPVWKWTMRSILLCAVLRLCGFVSATEPSFYGNPWSGNGLANLEVGRFPGRMVSYRFRAAETADFTTAKVFFIFAVFSERGYANGDGGQVRIELRPDDGSQNHFPDMTVAPLTSVLLADPVNKTKGAPIWGTDSHRSPDPRAGSSFREIPFPPARLQKGRLYHLVFSNPLGDPSNYTSLDLLNENRDVTAGIQRAASDTDWCALFKPSGKDSWKAHPGVTPILEIRYASGQAQGLGYIDASASTPQAIAGSNAVRTTFTVSGDDRAVSQVFFRLRRKENASDLIVRLEEGDGSSIEEGIVRGADLRCLPLVDGRSPAMGWASYTFSAARVLSLGKAYHLVLRSPQGAGYQTYAMQFGEAYGWTASNFKDGCYEFTTDGKIWQKVRGSRSFKQQLYFVVPGRMVRSWSASEPQRVADEQLYSKAEEAWRASWERFYDDRTHLFYDRVGSYDPKKRLASLPTPEEINRQFPNRNGWGTGMEDCAISGGVMLSMICDRFEATRDETLRQPARKAFAGMVLLGTLSPSEGFVIRGVCPADMRSHYCKSSRDQYTWYAYGLWRYYRSPLSSSAEKATMRNIIAAICARLERNVTAKNDWHIGREDGTFDGLVDKMWNVLAHEAARLPMIYAIGADLTGESRWRDLARRFSAEAATQSKGDSTKIAYALLQEQVSLEPLYQLEDSPGLKRQWLEAMRLVSARASAFLGKCRGYRPPDAEKVNLDWRSWKTQTSVDYLVPVTPDIVVKEDRTVRQPAEAALTQLLCPAESITPGQLALLKQTVAQVDYSKAVMYGLYYTQAVYWRAVRLGLLRLPTGTRG